MSLLNILARKKKFIEVISLFKKLNVLNNRDVFQPLCVVPKINYIYIQ